MIYIKKTRPGFLSFWKTMAFDIPYDQIREIQISLRKEVGLTSYNPEDPQFPYLPSLQDAISQLDPSLPYLRCKLCKGRLLRGINSVICVFCGGQQHKDVPPDPMKFSSTFGYRWFLQSLDLDGSELVAVESNESNRGQKTPEIELPLSDFLDLEIRFPSEPEKFESSVSEKTPAQWLSTQCLAGVDLDNFFTEAKIDAVSASTEGQFALDKCEDATGRNTFEGQGNLNLFESFKPSEEVPTMSENDESGDSFSGWEPDFQSAGSATGTQQQELRLSDPFVGSSGIGTQQQESKLSDPFVGSSSVDLSSQMDLVFGPGKELVVDKQENITSASNDWFEGDLWRKSDTVIAVQEDQFEVPTSAKDHITAGSTKNSSTVIDWVGDDQWHTTTSSNLAADSKTINEDDDSFDAWNDFTSSTSAQVPAINSLKQDVNCTVPSVEQESDSLFSGTSKSKVDDFSIFSQQDCISETFNNQNGSAEVNIMVSGSSGLDRMSSTNGKHRESIEEAEKLEKDSKKDSESKAVVAEVLMSQMHDLSFMLASDLSLPQKKDPQKIDPSSNFSDKD